MLLPVWLKQLLQLPFEFLFVLLCLFTCITMSVKSQKLSGRVSGTTNDHFNPQQMEEDLKPLAKNKKPGFDWELSLYSKSRRSQGADREGLAFYAPLLLIILNLCPKGFPNLGTLKIVWKQLQSKYDIMDPMLRHIYEKNVDVWASMCCDRVRLACSHIVSLKRSGTQYVSDQVLALLNLIKPTSTSSSSTSTVILPTPPPSRALKAYISSSSTSSDVVLCGIDCQCPECKKTTFVSDEESSTSVIAQTNIQTVPAGRGGQKRKIEEMASEAGEGQAEVIRKPAAAKSKHPKSKPPQPDGDDEKPDGDDETPGQEDENPYGDDEYRIANRNTPADKRQCYLMKNGKCFVISTEKQSANYKDIISKIVAEIKNGELQSQKHIVKARVVSLIGE